MNVYNTGLFNVNDEIPDEEQTPLLPEDSTRRMLEILKVKNYSQKTCEVYKKWVEAFLLKYNHRNNLGQKEINDFLTELAVKKHVSPSTQNQALASLLFYFGFVKNENPVELASLIHAKKKGNYSAPKIPGIMQDFQQRQVLQLQKRLSHVFLLSPYKNGF